MGGGEEEFILLSCEGISSKVDLDSKWHPRLQSFREVENLYSNDHVVDIADVRPSFTVPRIIMLGEESSGKSSTLERIAMMQFFPTDRQICTRMPIELRLRYRSAEEIHRMYESLNKPHHEGYVKMSIKRFANSTLPVTEDTIFPPHEAANKVSEWMTKFVVQGNGSVTGILRDVLVIELNSTRKLNLDLIDLPGIVGAYVPGEPSDMMIQTKELAESYVNDPLNPHCLIVCVVSSRTERVRNSQAMEIVQRFQKTRSAIGVLTMIDRCGDSRNAKDPFLELKDRLSGKTQDLPSLHYGYVALKNRDTSQQQFLADINQAELDWVRNNLPNLKGIISSKSQNAVGIDALITKLLHMLDSYTEQKWAPEEITRLSNELTKTKEILCELGPVMPTLQALVSAVMRNVITDSSSHYSYAIIQSKCSSFAVTVFCQNYEYGTENYFRYKLSDRKTIQLTVSELVHSCIVHPINLMMNAAFGECDDSKVNMSLAQNQQRLRRFTKLRSVLEKVLINWALEMKDRLVGKINEYLDITSITLPPHHTSTSYINVFDEYNNRCSYGSPTSLPNPYTTSCYPFHAVLLDFIFTELLTNPLSVYVYDSSVGTVQSFDNFTQKLIHTHAIALGHATAIVAAATIQDSDIKAVEVDLLTESCETRRIHLNNKIMTLNSMIQAISSEFPSTTGKTAVTAMVAAPAGASAATVVVSQNSSENKSTSVVHPSSTNGKNGKKVTKK